MDNVVQGYHYSSSINLFGFEQVLIPAFSDQNLSNGLGPSCLLSDRHQFAFARNNPDPSNLAPSPWTRSEEGNVSESVLDCISQMLMEDDDGLENRPSLLQDSAALQAAEKSLYDALGEKYPPPSPNDNWPLISGKAGSLDEDFNRTCSSHSGNSAASPYSFVDSNSFCDQTRFESSFPQSFSATYNFYNLGPSSSFCDIGDGTLASLANSFQVLGPSKEIRAESQIREREVMHKPSEDSQNLMLERKEKTEKIPESEESRREPSPARLRRKSHYREDVDSLEAGPSNKQLASYAEDSDEQWEMCDEVLLCPALNPHLHHYPSTCVCDESSENGMSRKMHNGVPKRSNRGRPSGKKGGSRREVVDLMTLLTQCAHAVANNDTGTANELLKQIRLHSSPLGDSTERTAHYFGNALEARLAGTGRLLDASPLIKRLSIVDTLKAYKAFLTASPFKKMTTYFANKSIWKLAEKATRLHIIDFGIIHGFQWPRLIQHLSLRPGGPPTICITGIDFPQPGFRPAERVEETGRRMLHYCKRFNVPFEYNGVAKKWDTITLEDLKIQKDEVLVVTCLFRLMYVPDETVDLNSPRDMVLNLIRRTHPDLFIHGIVNGANNGPFFFTRFRETLSMAYSAFDMFDAILPRDNQGRMLYESEVLGRGAMSVVACEGTDRVIRPETYKQWQVRNLRAGFRPVPLDKEIVEDVRAKVKVAFHKDFMVDEDGNWMLQGWKGKILNAISCWKPAQE